MYLRSIGMIIVWIITVEYLVTEVFETPFDFFQNFGTYWESKGWSRIGHQLEDLFHRLLMFLETIEGVNIDIVKSLMQLDYLMVQQFQPRKLWWKERPTEEQQKAIYNALRENPSIAGETFANFNLSEKELFKHTLVVPHHLDYQNFTKGKIVQKTAIYSHISVMDKPRTLRPSILYN